MRLKKFANACQEIFLIWHYKYITSKSVQQHNIKTTTKVHAWCFEQWNTWSSEHTNYRWWKRTRLVKQWWKTCGFHSSRLYQTYPYVKLKKHSTRLSETSPSANRSCEMCAASHYGNIVIHVLSVWQWHYKRAYISILFNEIGSINTIHVCYRVAA